MPVSAAVERPKWLSSEEFWSILTGRDKDGDKKMMSFRLSAEARRIIEAAGEQMGDKTKAVELMARLYREEFLQQERKKK